MEDLEKPKRRSAFALLSGLAVLAVGSQWALRLGDRLNGGFEFEELQSPPGFRRIPTGVQSVIADPFIGLDAAPTPHPEVEIMDLDQALFYDRTSETRVQLAYFSDLYCPYCRVLSQQILRIAADSEIDVSWHETPIFGEASLISAKGHIAAGRQNQYAPFHKVLAGAPVLATEPYLLTVAERLGLDTEQFAADLKSDETLQDLGRAAALANIFGLVGTPALVVGRTLVVGQISEVNLRQLIALEAAAL